MVNNYSNHIFVQSFLVFLLFDIKVINSHGLDKYFIDFDTAMNATTIRYYKKYAQGYNKEIIAKLKALYERNHFSKLQRSQEPKIAKIIHQIWVGSKPVPEALIKLAKTWRDFHPDWEYKLWTNDMVVEIISKFSLEHQKLYFSLEDPRFKADLLRYYILYLYGGLYVDGDFKCLASFSELHHCYDFYVGISSHTAREIINNALIGSAKGHPLLKNIIDGIKEVAVDKLMNFLGVFYFSNKVVSSIDFIEETSILLPTNILYSLPYLYNVSRSMQSYICSESMAVHYWAYGSNFGKDNKHVW